MHVVHRFLYASISCFKCLSYVQFPYFQPRLGPKPFSVGSGDVNFDKVFSVPQAPGADRGANNQNNEVVSDNPNKSAESSDSSIDEQKDSDEKEGIFSFNDFISFLLLFVMSFSTQT